MTEAIIPSLIEETIGVREVSERSANGAVAVATIGKKRLMHDIIREALQSSAPKRGARRDNTQSHSDSSAAFENLLSSTPESQDSLQSTHAIASVDTSASEGQLVFDADGNIVLSAAPVTNSADYSFSGTVVDAMLTGYEFAYKKTRPTKWSPDETDRFYSALSRFGSDLMLVNTSFPSLSASQIRQKFKAENRRAPKRVAEALHRSKTAKLAPPVSEPHSPAISMHTPTPSSPAIPLDALDDLLQL